MRAAYFDCFSGISGDMVIGALLDAGMSFEKLSREIAKLKLKGYRLKKRRTVKGGIAAVKFDCIADKSRHDHRPVSEIYSIIGRSGLNARVKGTATRIFAAIAAAEMKVHGASGINKVALHELGDIDSIIDIVGAAIALDALGIEAVYSSVVSMGRAIVPSRHGNIPVPSPAAVELMKGAPVSFTEIRAELVTPTGAGIISALAGGFGKVPAMDVRSVGYGAGSRDIEERPNVLRVIIGDVMPAFKEDRVCVIETDIDDISPQHIAYAAEKAISAGALDAYVSNIQMKKSRPAFKLTVVADASRVNDMAQIIFAETSAIGARYYEAGRLKLERSSKKISTPFGKIGVKISQGPRGIRTVAPEYDDCVRAAGERKVPLKKIYDAARNCIVIAALFFCAPGIFPNAYADTLKTTGGKEVKGIVVEEYKDRIVFSTIDGEISIMKSNIDELYYDSEEDNLIKLAEQAKEKRDYIKALTYYDMAFKINPNSKEAKDGLVFLEGYLFRKEQAQKEDDVKKREDLEQSGAVTKIASQNIETMAEKSARLDKVIGIRLKSGEALAQVTAVRPRSPADEAGIKEGDRISAIWSRLTGYMELKDVMDALLDKPSLEIKCTIDRDVEIERPVDASFSMEFEGLTVSSAQENSRAFKGGLKKGDLIISIDGKSTRYMPLAVASKLMKSPRGSAVKLTARRETLIWRRD